MKKKVLFTIILGVIFICVTIAVIANVTSNPVNSNLSNFTKLKVNIPQNFFAEYIYQLNGVTKAIYSITIIDGSYSFLTTFDPNTSYSNSMGEFYLKNNNGTWTCFHSTSDVWGQPVTKPLIYNETNLKYLYDACNIIDSNYKNAGTQSFTFNDNIGSKTILSDKYTLNNTTAIKSNEELLVMPNLNITLKHFLTYTSNNSIITSLYYLNKMHESAVWTKENNPIKAGIMVVPNTYDELKIFIAEQILTGCSISSFPLPTFDNINITPLAGATYIQLISETVNQNYITEVLSTLNNADFELFFTNDSLNKYKKKVNDKIYNISITFDYNLNSYGVTISAFSQTEGTQPIFSIRING
ncbi:MAG: hypothetical protein RR054_00410 [Clostridia bacterium]